MHTMSKTVIKVLYRDGSESDIPYPGTEEQAKVYADNLVAMDSYSLIAGYQIGVRN